MEGISRGSPWTLPSQWSEYPAGHIHSSVLTLDQVRRTLDQITHFQGPPITQDEYQPWQLGGVFSSFSLFPGKELCSVGS